VPRNCGALLSGVLARRGERSKVVIVDMSAPECLDGIAVVLQSTSVAKACRYVGRMAASGLFC
jgi:hypothetical protein